MIGKKYEAQTAGPKQAPDKSWLYHLMTSAYLAIFIILGIFFDFSPLIYVTLFLVSGIFILPSARTGLIIIIILTMLFERFFTLQSLTIDQQIYKLYPLDIIIGLTLIAVLLELRFKKIKFKLIFQTPEKILLIFMAITFLYLMFSLININAQFSVAFSTFKNYGFYPLLYFLTIYLINDGKKLKNVIHWLLGAAVLIIGFIFIGFIRGQGLWTEFTPLSTEGTRFLAGTHGFYLVFATLICLSLLAFNRFRNAGLALIVIVIWQLGILGSLMRHLWLALALGAMLLFIFLPKENKKNISQSGLKIILITLTIALVFILTINLLPDQINSDNQLMSSLENLKSRITSLVYKVGDSSINWRLGLWQSAQKAWLTNPIFGVGLGKKIPLELEDWQVLEEIRNLHNSPLAILIQMGILGLTIFIAFIAAVIVRSWRYLFLNNELKPYYLGVMIGVFTFLFTSLFQPYLETNLTGIFFWIFLGLLRTSETINK